MSDPLSIAGSVVGIVSLGIQVAEGLFKYYSAHKDRNQDLKQTTERLEALLVTLTLLEETIKVRKFHPDERDLLKSVNSSILSSEEWIKKLQKKCDKIQNLSKQDLKGAITSMGRSVLYPFRQSTIQKLHEIITMLQDNLVLAVDVLLLRNDQQLQDDITTIKQLTETVRADQLSADIRHWLNAPDATINHNTACAKRHPGTGLWFVQGASFTSWLHDSNSFLWVNGFAGCGKSVLCSTAIQHTFRQRRANFQVGICFFYFTFNDERKQDVSAMLRALIQQLICQSSTGVTEVSTLYSSYKGSTPPDTVLLAYLHRLVQTLSQAYLLVDALDEVPRGPRRRAVLDTLETIRSWNCPGLHLLVTSRDEVDIRNGIRSQPVPEAKMRNTQIDDDINKYVAGCLKADPQLLKWKAHHDQIQETLAKKAQGVFRWAECQLESIKRCPRSVKRLEQCLLTLPEDLDETYERILCNIGEESVRDARRILTVLCFSMRPLTISELTDAVAVELDESPHLDRDQRLEDIESVLEICPGLIQVHYPEPSRFDEFDDTDEYDELESSEEVESINELESNDDESLSLYSAGEPAPAPVLRIAHFSVQEYLESTRNKNKKAQRFALNSSVSHAEITQICLTYLFEPELLGGPATKEGLQDLPFVDYAAGNWFHHYANVTDPVHIVHTYALQLLCERHQLFQNCVRIHNPDEAYAYRPGLKGDCVKTTPLYYSACLGLEAQVVGLCNLDVDLNIRVGELGSALNVASSRGHERVVQILLDNGADVNAQGGYCGTALQAASDRGHGRMVQILLDNGADVNAQGGQYFDTALQAASSRGHERVVQILLDNGADVNAQGGYYSTALQAASYGGHERVVQILLDNGADVKAQGGQYFDTALQAASDRGHGRMVQVLLDNGADVNAQGGYCGTALQAASYRGREQVVQILLDNGADVNAQGGHHSTALQAASSRGHERVVQILSLRGATG